MGVNYGLDTVLQAFLQALPQAMLQAGQSLHVTHVTHLKLKGPVAVKASWTPFSLGSLGQ
jgi:hypothetical protein